MHRRRPREPVCVDPIEAVRGDRRAVARRDAQIGDGRAVVGVVPRDLAGVRVVVTGDSDGTVGVGIHLDADNLGRPAR